MAVKRYVGDKIVGLNSEKAAVLDTVSDGALYYTNDSPYVVYLKKDGAWQQISSSAGGGSELTNSGQILHRDIHVVSGDVVLNTADIDIVSGDLLNTGQILHRDVHVISGRIATDSTLGNVKFACNCSQSTAPNIFTDTTDRSYAVTPNSTNQMVVNVPWIDSTANLNTTGSLLHRDVHVVSGNLHTTGDRLHRDIHAVSGNLHTTGDFLHRDIHVVSGRIDSNDTDITNLTTNLDTTGNLLHRDVHVVSGNLHTTGDRLHRDVHAVSGRIDSNDTDIADLTTNLDTTGNLLHRDIHVVSGVAHGKASDVFKTIAVQNSDDVVAAGITDTLTFVAGSNTTITTDSSNQTVTICSAGAAGGEANVQSDWTQSSNTSDAFILNKPGILGVSSNYTAGSLLPEGNATHGGNFLRKDGSWAIPFTLSTATNSALGGIKLVSDTAQTVASESVSSTANRSYAIQLDSSCQAVVNVPWLDTDTWQAVSTSQPGYVAQLPASHGGKFLKADGNWEVPAYDTTNTTYTVSIPNSTTKLRLAGSDSTSDDIEFVGAGLISVARTNDSKFTISTTATNNTGTVTCVTGTSPITSSGGTTPAISLANSGVTYAKIQNVSATNRILGRDSAGAGVIEEITPASLRTMLNVADGATANAGTVTGVTGTAPIASSGGTAPAISLNDSGVTYAKIQNVSATNRILGRDSAGAGVIEEITPASLRTMLQVAQGATACEGTVESVSAGTGLTAGGTAADPSLSLDTATSTALGGIKVSTGLTINASTGALSVTVPTTHNFTNDLKTKLDNIEVGATADLTATEICALAGITGNIQSNAYTSTTIPTDNDQLANGCGYTTNIGTVTPSSSDTFTNKSGNISQWTNDANYSTTVGTVTSVTAASPLTATTGATPQISLPVSACVTINNLCTCGTNNCLNTTILCSAFVCNSILINSGLFNGGVYTFTGNINTSGTLNHGTNHWIKTNMLCTCGTNACIVSDGGNGLIKGCFSGDGSAITNLDIGASDLPNIAKCEGTVTSVGVGAGLCLHSTANSFTVSDTICNTDKGSSQNIFKNIGAYNGATLIGTVAAAANNDTVCFVQGSNITLTHATDKITIAADNTTYNQANASTLGLVKLSGTPADNITDTAITSNYIFDNLKTPVPANAVFTDTCYSQADSSTLGLVKISDSADNNASDTAISADWAYETLTIPSLNILGNNTGSSAEASGLTCAQVLNLLGVAAGATANTGTVTSVSGGTGLSGTVTGTGSLALNQATTSSLGGIIVGTGLSVSNGTVSVTNLAFSADGCKNGTGQAGYVCPAGLCTNYCAAVSSANAFVGCSTNNCVDVTTVKASTLVDVSSGSLNASCIDVGTQTATGLITALKLCGAGTGNCVEATCGKFTFLHTVFSMTAGLSMTALRLCATGASNCVEATCLKGNLLATSLTGTIDAARLPVATGSALGGIKVGDRLTITDGVLSANVQTGSNTTYDLAVPNSTTNIALTGSDSTTDTVQLVGGTNVTLCCSASNQITITSSDQYTGTVTSVSAGTGLTAGGTATAPSLSLNQATGSALGGIKVSTGLTINASTGALSVTVPTANDFTNACSNKLSGLTTGFSAAGADSDFVCPRGSVENYCAKIICSHDNGNCIKGSIICATSALHGEGSNITDLDASEIKSGTVATTYLPAAALCTGTVNNVGSTADDVLGISSASICAHDAGSDKIVFWDDSVGALKYLTAGSNLSISGTTITATNTNTQNVFTSSWYKSSGTAVCLRLTKSGASSGTQDIKICQGSNITLTKSANGTCLTIAASGTGGGCGCVLDKEASSTGHDMAVYRPDTTDAADSIGCVSKVRWNSSAETLTIGSTTASTTGELYVCGRGSASNCWQVGSVKMSSGALSHTSSHFCLASDANQGYLNLYNASCSDEPSISQGGVLYTTGQYEKPHWRNSSGCYEIYMTSVSDYRFKQNLRCWSSICCTTDVVKNVPVYAFNWNSEGLKANTFDSSSTERVGFLAHEVKEKVTANNLVTANKDGTQADGKIIPQTINHIEMIPILWSALQETIKKVEDLEERVKTLESS